MAFINFRKTPLYQQILDKVPWKEIRTGFMQYRFVYSQALNQHFDKLEEMKEKHYPEKKSAAKEKGDNSSEGTENTNATDAMGNYELSPAGE